MGRKQRTASKANAPAGSRPAMNSPLRSLAREQVLNHPLLLLVAACQLVTLLISWPVWNVRTSPPLLPLIPLPEISFGIPLVISLLAAVIWPRIATIGHCVLLGLAIVADQTRLQPQVISLAVLMLGCLNERTVYFARWYLAAMWLWAGLHKFLSPEWYGFQAWWFLNECGLAADAWHLPFAILVAACETVIGVLAICKPKWATWPAVVLHVGLLLLLSPLVRNFNASVWPWNIATAAAAYWILQRSTAEMISWPKANWWLRIAAVASLLCPALYYVNWLNPHLAFVLYSGNMPRAIHVTGEGYRHLDGWTGLSVPFPDSHRLFCQLFQKTASPGEKLHIADPRWGIADRYFVLDEEKQVLELSRDQFWKTNNIDSANGVRAIELEDVQLVWQLRQAGIVDKQQGWEMVTAAQLSASTDKVIPLRRGIVGLRNLKELTISGRHVYSVELDAFKQLKRLEWLTLENCDLDDYLFVLLRELSSLNALTIKQAILPTAGLKEFLAQPKLLVLELPNTTLIDEELTQISPDSRLISLDVSHTKITASGLQQLSPLQHCEWLNLSGTAVNDDAIPALTRWPKLEVLIVGGTKITPAGKAELKAALPALRILDEAP